MPAIKPQPTEIGRILRELSSLYGGVREDLYVKVELPENEIQAMVDPILLRQALVNVLDNAVWAIPGRGSIAITAGVDEADVVIEVTDTGVGLPTEDTETLVEPFFSTKGRGSGVGLALVHRIVSDHGGTLELGSLEEGGARVRMVFENALVATSS
jgi:nitrogen fixation/metabolism regulation signal transduction histidine kinase